MEGKMKKTILFSLLALTFASSPQYANSGNLIVSGSLGIGTTTPQYVLDVADAIRVENNTALSVINMQAPEITSNATNYFMALNLTGEVYNIPSGVTDSGYRMGLAVQSFVNDPGFLGTLSSQYGIYVMNGSYEAPAGGAITNSYGVYIDTATSGATHIQNLYGLYQGVPAAKNYFAGNVGIGMASPNETLDVSSAGAQSIQNVLGVFNPLTTGNAENHGAAIIVGYADTEYYAKIATVFESQSPNYLQPALAFYTMYNSYLPGSEVERMRISSTGNVGIGTSTPGYTLQVNGSAWVTSGQWTGSDVRWKKEVAPLECSLEKVSKLQGVSYRWRADEFPEHHFSEDKQIGLIAQETEKVIPEVVTTDIDGYKGISYEKLCPLLIEAVKELKADNDRALRELRAENARLGLEVKRLRATVKQTPGKDRYTLAQ